MLVIPSPFDFPCEEAATSGLTLGSFGVSRREPGFDWDAEWLMIRDGEDTDLFETGSELPLHLIGEVTNACLEANNLGRSDIHPTNRD